MNLKARQLIYGAGVVVAPVLLLLVADRFFHDWMFAAVGLGWASWWGLVLSAIGFAFAIWSIFIAIREARSAGVAARAATDAVSSLKHYTDVAAIAYENAQFQALHHAISSGAIPQAMSIFMSSKRAITLHGPRSSTTSSSSLNRALVTLTKQLNHAVQGSALYDQSITLSAVQGIIGHLTAWELELRKASEDRSAGNANVG